MSESLKRDVEQVTNKRLLEQIYKDTENGICTNDPAKQVVDWSKVDKQAKPKKCKYFLPCGRCDKFGDTICSKY